MPTIYAAEDFGVDDGTGWGSTDAPAAVAWTPSSSTQVVWDTAADVGRAMLSVAATAKHQTLTGLTSHISEEISGSVIIPRGSGSSGNETHVHGRYIDASNGYRLHVYTTSTGVTDYRMETYIAGVAAGVGGAARTNFATLDVGVPLKFRIRLIGSSPTTVQMRLWTGTSEPATWLVNTTDASAALQAASAGFRLTHTVESGATGFPYTWKWEALLVTDGFYPTAVTRGLLLRGVGGSRSAVVEPFALGSVVRTISEPFDLIPGQAALCVVEPFEMGVTAFRTIVEPFALTGVAQVTIVEPVALLGPSDAVYDDGSLAQPMFGFPDPPVGVELLV